MTLNATSVAVRQLKHESDETLLPVFIYAGLACRKWHPVWDCCYSTVAHSPLSHCAWAPGPCPFAWAFCRFKTFNMAFEELHRTQCLWKIPDEELCSAVQLQIAEVLLPAYRSFVSRYK